MLQADGIPDWLKLQNANIAERKQLYDQMFGAKQDLQPSKKKKQVIMLGMPVIPNLAKAVNPKNGRSTSVKPYLP